MTSCYHVIITHLLFSLPLLFAVPAVTIPYSNRGKSERVEVALFQEKVDAQYISGCVFLINLVYSSIYIYLFVYLLATHSQWLGCRDVPSNIVIVCVLYVERTIYCGSVWVSCKSSWFLFVCGGISVISPNMNACSLLVFNQHDWLLPGVSGCDR